MRRIIYPLLFSTALWSAGCVHGFEQGTQALRANDLDRAQSIAQTELKDDPSSPWANLVMAEALAAGGDHRQALSYAERADQDELFPGRAPRLLGEIYQKLGHPIEAAGYYQRAHDADPSLVDEDHLRALYIEALPIAAAKRDHRAQWQLRLWLSQIAADHEEATPKRLAAARRAYAISLRDAGEYRATLDLLNQALADDPALLTGEALDLADVYSRLEMIEDARQAWQTYLTGTADKDERTQRHFDVAEAAAHHGDFPTAIAALTAVLPELDPTIRASKRLDLAFYQLSAHQDDDARQTLADFIDEGTKGYPQGAHPADIYRRAAELALLEDRTRMGIQILEQGTLNALPSRAITRQLADIYARRAQLDALEEILNRFIDKSDGELDALLFAASWAQERRNHDLSRHYLSRAAEADDASPTVFLELAQVQGELENYDELIQAIMTYLKKSGRTEESLSRAAALLANHRIFEEAEPLLLELRRLKPENQTSAAALASLYRRWERPQDSIKAWEGWIKARGDRPADMEQVAQTLLHNGELDLAARFFRQAGQAGANVAWIRAADIYLQQDDQAAMIAAFDSYLEGHTDRARALEEIAARYQRAQMKTRQIQTLRELLELQPQHWPSRDALVTLLLEHDQEEEALQLLTDFVDQAPDTLTALTQISERFSNSPYASFLLELYAQLLDEDATNSELWRLMGDAYYGLSRQRENADEAKESLLRHARKSYLRFIETADGDHNWRRLARDWAQREMWRPAALATEKYTTGTYGYDQRDYLDIAEVYLRTGQPERAEEFLASSGLNAPPAADGNLLARTARLLYRFQRYDAAEGYAHRVFDTAPDIYSAIEAFTTLAAIYKEREDLKALDRLIAEFPEKTSNRREARYQAYQALVENGRWEQAIREGHRLKIHNLHGSTQGNIYLAMGDPEAAFEAFEEAIKEGHPPADSWLSAANSFEDHGEVELARQAFEQARRAAPDEAKVRLHYARFLAKVGDLQDSLREYKAALKADPERTAHLSEPYLQALIKAGRFDLVRQAMDIAAEASVVFPDSFMLEKYSWDLRSQDKADFTRAIAGLHAHSWGVNNVALHLREAGLHQELYRLMSEEFEEGDAATASILLLTSAAELAWLSDWDTHRAYLEAIIDPLRRSDTRLIGIVGDLRSRTGDLESARTYLQAAVDYGDHEYLAQLGHTLLNLGEPAQGAEYFRAWLLQNPTEEALESILLRFELAGKPEGASKFLAELAQEPPLLHIALPQKLHYDLERHANPQRAIQTLFSHLERARRLPSRAFRTSQRRQTSVYQPRQEILSLTLSRSLETIAALGFLDAAEAALQHQEIANYNQETLIPLRLKLAIAKGDLERAQEMAHQHLSEADGAQARQELRLDLARQFLAIGADSPARALVDEALKEQVDFRSHQPIALHLGLLLLEDQSHKLLDEIRAYLDRVPNRLSARRTIIDELRRLGRDDEALTLALEMAELIPTENNLKTALTTALDAGDSTEAQRLASLFVNASSIDSLRELLEPRLMGSEPHLMLPLIKLIRSARHTDLDWLLMEMRLLFIDGQIDEARQLMLDAARERNYDREAITLITNLLVSEQLDVELAKVLAPALPDSALWPRTIIRISEALFALGFADDAQSWLQRLDESALEPALWRIELGNRLAIRHLFTHIPHALEGVNEERSPQARYLRGVADIGLGDAEEGLANLQRANQEGVRLIQTHYYAIIAALQAQDKETVHRLMGELMELPINSAAAVAFPFQMALRAAMDREGGPEAIIEFLETQRPRLIDGQGATWTQFAGQLAGAFERTGDPQGAYGFYRDRIWQAQFRSREDRSLPIYLNNLAYTYSTTNHEIDRGLKNSYRSLILAQERNSSYIDTLGWLLYRKGDPAAAEAEVRRALRNYDGPPSGLRELTLHLKELLEARGALRQAAWLDVQLNRLPLHDFE